MKLSSPVRLEDAEDMRESRGPPNSQALLRQEEKGPTGVITEGWRRRERGLTNRKGTMRRRKDVCWKFGIMTASTSRPRTETSGSERGT